MLTQAEVEQLRAQLAAKEQQLADAAAAVTAADEQIASLAAAFADEETRVAAAAAALAAAEAGAAAAASDAADAAAAAATAAQAVEAQQLQMQQEVSRVFAVAGQSCTPRHKHRRGGGLHRTDWHVFSSTHASNVFLLSVAALVWCVQITCLFHSPCDAPSLACLAAQALSKKVHNVGNFMTVRVSVQTSNSHTYGTATLSFLSLACR